MTLILTVGTRKQTFMVADRRLTEDGQVRDDDAGKLGILELQDARLVFGFTGPARFADFETEFWLLDALGESAKPDNLVGATLDRLKSKATEDFEKDARLKKISPSSKRLSVVFGGYLIDGRGVGAILTNFENPISGVTSAEARDQFELFHQMDDPTQPPQPMIQWTGYWPAVKGDDTKSLCEIIDQDRPLRAIGTSLSRWCDRSRLGLRRMVS